jgi:isoquinoline 1-oxidoreductase subunit beta
MDELILREQTADEAAMSRRAFLQGTGLLLGFALTGASTDSVFAAPASRVLSRRMDLYGSIQPAP